MGAPDSVRATAEKWSAYLNTAYETLRDEYKRALYLYQLGTGKRLEEELEEIGTSEPGLDELLAQVMELRMELEDCQDIESATEILKTNKQKINVALKDTNESLSRKDWKEARSQLIRLRYWKSIDDVGKQVIEDLSS